MFTTLTKANKKTDRVLDISYSQEYVVDDETRYLAVTRRARKEYSFIGLSSDAADKIVKLKRAKYMRYKERFIFNKQNQHWVWDEGILLPVPMATVEKVNEGGGIYSVKISVDEEDVRYLEASVDPKTSRYRFEADEYGMCVDPAKEFETINSVRSYDEDGAGSPIEFLKTADTSHLNVVTNPYVLCNYVRDFKPVDPSTVPYVERKYGGPNPIDWTWINPTTETITEFSTSMGFYWWMLNHVTWFRIRVPVYDEGEWTYKYSDAVGFYRRNYS